MMLKNNLNQLLKENEITKSVFSKKIDVNYAKGISYLKGTNPPIDILIKISEVFEVSIDDLLLKDLSTKNEIVEEENEPYTLQEKENYKERYYLLLAEHSELQKSHIVLLKKYNALKKPNSIKH
jgi:transcriptional regulator with XRE-family HTH domain